MAENTVTDVVIYRATRAASSTAGNPSWYLHTNRGPYRTQANAMLGYAIENLIAPTYRPPSREHVIANPLEPRVTLVTTAAGRVYDITDRNGSVTR